MYESKREEELKGKKKKKEKKEAKESENVHVTKEEECYLTEYICIERKGERKIRDIYRTRGNVHVLAIFFSLGGDDLCLEISKSR